MPKDIQVIDVEQVVVQGLLTLSVLVDLSSNADAGSIVESAELKLGPLGMQVSSAVSDTAESPNSHRQTITVLGAPLTARSVSHLATSIAETGANIDRIERIASYPVTALELSVSGVELPSLRSRLARLATAEGIDIAVQQGGINRRGRQLVVMDVDSTVIQDEVIELLARPLRLE